MGFEKIPTVEKYDFYIDLAFRSANKRAGTMVLKQKLSTNFMKAVRIL